MYILGDLFEAWIGDDYIDPALQSAIDKLAHYTKVVPTYLMHGNRDFLLSSQFEAMTGVKILPDEVVINLFGKPTLLLHGDTLCTDDVEYQNVRSQVRNKQWMAQVLTLPIEQRLAMASQFRMDSQTSKNEKSEEIMDVNQMSVEAAMIKHHVNLLIHGHTHRPKVHNLVVNNHAAKRIVLGDWYKTASVLRFTAQGFSLQ